MLITPQYEAAQEFSEGLCAVRQRGTYGFINTGGDMVIPNVYDYATHFNEGFALVYKDGKPMFINHDGRVMFDPVYSFMSPYKNGLSHVRTRSKKAGVINTAGKLVVDTVYQQIWDFENNLAVVVGFNHNPSPREGEQLKLEIGVIRADGKIIVPFGKYSEIHGPSEGFFRGNIPLYNEDNETKDVIFNSEGKITFSLRTDEYSWFEENVSCGIIMVKVPPERGVKRPNEDYYTQYVTTSGKVVYDNREVEFGENFSENYLLAKSSERNRYILVDRQGKSLLLTGVDKIIAPGFKNGKALVRVDDKWGIIDTAANFILKPTFDNVHQVGFIDDLFFFSVKKSNEAIRNDSTDDDDYHDPKFGLADIHGRVIIEPQFQYFDQRGFIHGLLRTWIDERVTFFNRKGEIVWQQPESEPSDLVPLNIDFMNRGYFYAGETNTGHGGAGYLGQRKKISMLNSFPSAALAVTIDPDAVQEYGKGTKGMAVYVSNSTGDSVAFNAQDRRLYMTMQAKDQTGTWRDIEYLPSSWCGNSYHSLHLSANNYWSFIAPVYEGSFHTQLRVALQYVDLSDTVNIEISKSIKPDWPRTYRGRTLLIYSNEIEGSINPAQFWRRPEYYPAGLMDPYSE